MKQFVLYGPRDLRVEEKPRSFDQVEPGQLLVKTEVTAMSLGTERNLYTYVDPHWFEVVTGSHPIVMGYNNVGRVQRVGSKVQRFREGDRVFTLAPHVDEYTVEEDGIAVPVPAGVHAAEAAHIHLLNLGLHALRRGGFTPGQHVAIVGLGVIGLGAVALAKTLGARVVAVGHHAPRLAAARRLGADLAVDSREPAFREQVAEFGGEIGVDLAIVTPNSWTALRDACEIVRENGTVATIGHPGVGVGLPDFNPFDPAWYYMKQITFASVSFVPTRDYPAKEVRFTLTRNYQYILDLMRQGKLQIGSMISDRYPFADAAAAYERVAAGDPAITALVFDW